MSHVQLRFELIYLRGEKIENCLSPFLLVLPSCCEPVIDHCPLDSITKSSVYGRHPAAEMGQEMGLTGLNIIIIQGSAALDPYLRSL